MTKLPNPCCVVKVGGGRGFLIEHRIRIPACRVNKTSYPSHVVKEKLIVTAAHCLPQLPPAHALSYTEDRTYMNLLGRLDGAKNKVSSECLFVDPVADIAVLGAPDNQVFYDEVEGYDALVDDAPTLSIGIARSGKGWLLALDRPEWIPTQLNVRGISLAIGPTEPGMSGSPILNSRGQAVGVVVIGSETVSEGRRIVNENAWGQPILIRNLPAWLVRFIPS